MLSGRPQPEICLLRLACLHCFIECFAGSHKSCQLASSVLVSSADFGEIRQLPHHGARTKPDIEKMISHRLERAEELVVACFETAHQGISSNEKRLEKQEINVVIWQFPCARFAELNDEH